MNLIAAEARRLNWALQDKSLYSITMKSGPLKLTVQFIQAFAFADQNLPGSDGAGKVPALFARRIFYFFPRSSARFAGRFFFFFFFALAVPGAC